MGSEKFIHCCVCDASTFDKAPTYVLVRDEVEAQATDDWRLFMAQHAGHRLEPLKASPISTIRLLKKKIHLP